MKALATFLLVCVSLLVTPAQAVSVTVLDPYLIRPNNLQNLQLKPFLQSNPALANYVAAKMSGDGVAAGIVLVQTNVNSPVTISDSTGLLGLRPYSDNFLTKPTGKGTPSLTISNLWHIKGNYYAVALTGVLVNAGGLNSDDFLASQEDGPSAEGQIALVLPPVVLVHGLWGNQSSLADIETYLEGTGKSNNWSTAPIPMCYSLYLKFDAKSDPLTDGLDPCEYTSEAALATAIGSTFSTLDSEHIVSGRVDIVAHSMGGLVLRNYAVSGGYKSPRNGMLGQFHTIVTLDTPEVGSELAPFLIQHRNDVRMAPLLSSAGALWSLVCGTTDVEACFAGIGDPLSAATLPIDTGAVYSLEPNYIATAKISRPSIPNTSWFAVSATAPGNGALGAGIDLLIAALYKNPSASDVPTVNSILQNLPNDAIVTVPSQLGGALSGQNTTESGLSHTTIPSDLLVVLDLLYVEPLNPNNVLEDEATDEELTCWLTSQNATGACLPGKRSNVSKASSGTIAMEMPARILSDGVKVDAPGKAQLGVPVDITVHFPPSMSVTQLLATQKGQTGESRMQEIRPRSSESGAARLSITPSQLGQVNVRMAIRFSDGSISFRTATVYVQPPVAKPLVFKANVLPYLELDLNGGTAIAQPASYAIYPDPVGRIWLNYQFVTYRLVSHPAQPVIEIRPSGLIHALAPGEVDVEARFGSVVDRVHVIVRATAQ